MLAKYYINASFLDASWETSLTARHKFDVKQADILDSPQRRVLLNPEGILRRVRVKPRMKVADVGCGTGFFTIPMAEIVGDRGKVFAIENQECGNICFNRREDSHIRRKR